MTILILILMILLLCLGNGLPFYPIKYGIAKVLLTVFNLFLFGFYLRYGKILGMVFIILNTAACFLSCLFDSTAPPSETAKKAFYVLSHVFLILWPVLFVLGLFCIAE